MIDPKVTLELARRSCYLADLLRHPELRAQNPTIASELSELMEAGQIVQDHYQDFVALIRERLDDLPLIHRFYGKLIDRRLEQDAAPASHIISVVLDDDPALELRLQRVQHVPDVEQLFSAAGGSRHRDQGEITDRIIQDVTAEVLILDFLLQQGFTQVQKLIANKGQPHPDVLAFQEGTAYAIEITRKQEVTDWKIAYDGTGEGGLEDCSSQFNQDRIRHMLTTAMNKKHRQFDRALTAGTISAGARRVVALKTSDFGFAQCIHEAAQMGELLLSNPDAWTRIDCLWLIPNVAVEDSKWVCRPCGRQQRSA